MRISVFASKELAGTILLLKGMDRELAERTRRAIKTVTQGEWQEAVRGGVGTRLETRVLSDTARVSDLRPERHSEIGLDRPVTGRR